MSEQKPIEVFIPVYRYRIGYLWIPFRLPTQFLSDLIIDVDKDWAGHRIKNLGAPIDLYDSLRLIDLINHKTSSPIDHPDGSVTTSKIADGAITTSKIADASVTRAKLSGVFPITTSDIADGSITTSKIADGAITTAKIADAAATAAKIADGSITTSKIADASITPSKINSVTAPADGYVLSYDGTSGLFKWTASAGGVSSLSQLIIDVDKDWGGHVIKNLGAPVDPGDSLRLQDLTSHKNASPIDHPDRSVTRAKLEYPTIDVPLLYLFAIGKASVVKRTAPNQYMVCLLTADSFADRAVEAAIWDRWGAVLARWVDTNNHYFSHLDSGNSAQDFQLIKRVGGATTVIGYEAVDITANIGCIVRLSCSGSTLKAYRDVMTTPKISVTDTSLSSGQFGEGTHLYGGGLTKWSVLCAPSSPSPQPIAYFEVPVVGSGTPDDPFRAQMPEEMAWEWSINPLAKKKYDILKSKGFTDEEILTLFPELQCCRTNRLALTHSALIKADRATGKPVEYVAIVRIFDQPDRQPHLRPISRALDELRSMKGARKLSREEAIRRAKQIDPDLTDVDLLPVDPKSPRFKQTLRDYVEHRKALGVKEDMIDEKLMEQYLQEDKGW